MTVSILITRCRAESCWQTSYSTISICWTLIWMIDMSTSQVPAYKGEDRGYVDLLLSRDPVPMVVIELKVSEDPGLPFQGLDYWLRSTGIV